MLDYLSDYICCLYGIPGAYGVVTMPFGVREGINIFLAGFIPTENLRFREDALTFKVRGYRGAEEREGGGEVAWVGCVGWGFEGRGWWGGEREQAAFHWLPRVSPSPGHSTPTLRAAHAFDIPPSPPFLATHRPRPSNSSARPRPLSHPPLPPPPGI